jgi:hypothetical protein
MMFCPSWSSWALIERLVPTDDSRTVEDARLVDRFLLEYAPSNLMPQKPGLP